MIDLRHGWILSLVLVACWALSPGVVAQTCTAPDNGTGTIDFPPPCPYDNFDDDMRIQDGLPPGSTIILRGPFGNFTNEAHAPGGTLGGTIDTFDAQFTWEAIGTGDLAGFERNLVLSVFAEAHTGPRSPGDPVQTFPNEIFQLQGELFGDPDFCVLRIRAGTDLGLPSPGQANLVRLPSGDFAVDSFFDITYQIEFEGCPDSVLADSSGVTQATVRLATPELQLAVSKDSGDVVIDWDMLPGDHRYDMLIATELQVSSCVEPDNGTGTIDYPPDCPFDNPDEDMIILDGLPPGTTILLRGPLENFTNQAHGAGGTLGGGVDTFDGEFTWEVIGTGELDGFHRNIVMPLVGEVHTGPRNPGDPVQIFATEMYSLQGQLFGDPDFCDLVVSAGSSHGLPSPGQTTLTELPGGDFAVDSFFDITYRIDFEGCPGSILEDRMGSTTATIRLALEQVTPWTRVVDVLPPWHHEGALFDGTDYFYRVDAVAGELPACVVPDNGIGTIDFPPDCPYDNPDEDMLIIDGLPPGSTILMRGPLEDFWTQVHGPGGTLGGGIDTFNGQFTWEAIGTGDLAGFHRNLVMPISAEVHTGPRNPGDSVQTFDTEMIHLQGELFGDPDFCELRIRAGSDLGLPSPGRTTLTRLPSGDFAVDSFFDITYEIEFEGCPASPLEDLAGTTTGTTRKSTR